MIETEVFRDVRCIKTATPGPDGNPIMWVYAFQVENALFDAGCANARDEFSAFINKSAVSNVYVTHAHEDHHGCVDTLPPEVTVHAWKSSIELLKAPPEIGEFFKYVWGQPNPVSKVSELPPAFSIDDYTFKVVEVPGHFEDMVAFYEPVQKWLFSADAVPLPSKKYIAMPEENIPLMIATMERIQDLDIEILFDSHRGPIVEPTEHIQVRIDYLKEMQKRVREYHADGLNVKEIMNKLDLQPPWYIEMTQDRFAIEFFIESLIKDTAE